MEKIGTSWAGGSGADVDGNSTFIKGGAAGGMLVVYCNKLVGTGEVSSNGEDGGGSPWQVSGGGGRRNFINFP